jgi:hypothetical protein
LSSHSRRDIDRRERSIQQPFDRNQQSRGYLEYAQEPGQFDDSSGPVVSWAANDSWSHDDSWPLDDSWPGDEQRFDGSWRTDETPHPEPADARPESPTMPTRSTRRRGGAHRLPPPPTALKGRAAVVAVAAGAVVAAWQGIGARVEKPAPTVEFQALGQVQAVDPILPDNSTAAPQLLNASGPTDIGQFTDLLHNGADYAQQLADQEAAKMRPLFTKFASGTFTSGYGARWGVLHPGVDVAAPIGTPIYAVEDGTVIDAGPAAGFGMWVRVRGDDGTITVYGHINTALVSVGQQVTAGDEIATVGNRGESTGPHCHFEVWLNGTNRIDPLPWLATRGISLGPERD